MSDGGNHPCTSDPVLTCVASYNGDEYDFVIQIMGDFLVILVHTPFPFGNWADEMFIWDWKKARLLTVRLQTIRLPVTLVLNYITVLKTSPFG